jgi:hypothetical protein
VDAVELGQPVSELHCVHIVFKEPEVLIETECLKCLLHISQANPTVVDVQPGAERAGPKRDALPNPLHRVLGPAGNRVRPGDALFDVPHTFFYPLAYVPPPSPILRQTLDGYCWTVWPDS